MRPELTAAAIGTIDDDNDYNDPNQFNWFGDDSDYEVISERSLDSSLADLNLHCASASEIFEPPPSAAAQERWPTTRWSPEDVREHVRRALDASAYSKYNQGSGREHVRVYVDGLWDGFNTACVYLISTQLTAAN